VPVDLLLCVFHCFPFAGSGDEPPPARKEEKDDGSFIQELEKIGGGLQVLKKRIAPVRVEYGRAAPSILGPCRPDLPSE